MRLLLFFSLLLAILSGVFAQERPDREGYNEQAKRVYLLHIDGVITPATTDYFERSLDKIDPHSAAFILLRIDTPGGLDMAMRKIIKRIIASPVPVVAYVAPGGARAASAGTYILYASHIAAMAPATNLGAATPVQIIPGSNPGGDKSSPDRDKEHKDKSEPRISGDPMTNKMVNDAVAYIKGLAKLRGRNGQWAELAVRTAASLPAEEALRKKVIDIVAMNQSDLFRQLDGREVDVLGTTKNLSTAGLIVEELAPDWRNELLTIITSPNIAYILLLAGIYGLIFEFANPGAILPGTVGAICLLLAFFSFQILPINYAGLALIFLGIALMIAEAFAPSFGVLGFGGITAFVFGSLILIDTDLPGYGVDIGLIIGFAITTAILFILAMGMVFKSRRNPIVSGQEEMVGAMGIVLESFDQLGRVRVHSEIWTARSDRPLKKGLQIKVEAIDGLTLIVTPASKQEIPA